MDVLTYGFNVDNMIGGFLSGICLFALARLGGIPVPSSSVGKLAWLIVVCIQCFEYALMALSLASIVMGYFRIRLDHRRCMNTFVVPMLGWDWPIMDVCLFFTVGAVPAINQILFVLFLYMYIISTCRKVYRVWSLDQKRSSHGWTRLSENSQVEPHGLPPYSTDIQKAALEKSRFTDQLMQPNAPRTLPLAMCHVWVAYASLAITLLISSLSGAIFLSLVLLPSALLVYALIWFIYRLVECVGDALLPIFDAMDFPQPRAAIGWFVDIAKYLRGFHIRDALRMPLLMGPSCIIDEAARTKELGVVDMGERDSGFVTMAYGFSVFFLCIIIAPMSCLGVWLSLPVISGTLPLDDAWGLLLSYYVNAGNTFFRYVDCLTTWPWSCGFDWPEWFDIRVLMEFIREPWKTVILASTHILKLVQFTYLLDISYLLQTAALIQKMNALLSLLKPATTTVFSLWLTLTWAIDEYVLKCIKVPQENAPSCCTGHRKLALVLFGDCLPPSYKIEDIAIKGTAQRALRSEKGTQSDGTVSTVRRRVLVKNLLSNQRRILESRTPRVAELLKEAGYKAADLLHVQPPYFSIEHLFGMSKTFTVKELVEASGEYNASGPSIADLKSLRSLGVQAEKLREAGISTKQLRDVGFNAKQMRDAGCEWKDLRGAGIAAFELVALGAQLADLTRAGYSWQELKNANAFTASQLRAAGAPLVELRQVGYTWKELIAANFSSQQMKSIGASAKELSDAGTGALELIHAGYNWVEVASTKAHALSEMVLGGQVNAEQLRAQFGTQVSAKLKEIGDADKLKKAGFHWHELKAGGFSAAQLKAVQASAKELQMAGYSWHELRGASFSAQQLVSAGATAHDLVGGHVRGYTWVQLKSAGISASELKGVGATVKDLSGAGFGPVVLTQAGFGLFEVAATKAGALAEMVLGGVEINAEAMRAHYGAQLPKQLSEINDAAKLRGAGFEWGELKLARFSATQLKAVHASPADLIRVGYTWKELKAARYPVRELKYAGADARSLLGSGCTWKELKDASFTASELKQAFATASEARGVGFEWPDLTAAGYTVAELKQARATAKDLAGCGFTAKQLSSAGFSTVELANAGYRLKDVLATKAGAFKEMFAGGKLNAQQMRTEFGSELPARLREINDIEKLKKAKFTASELQTAGFPDSQLIQAGYKLDQARGGQDLLES